MSRKKKIFVFTSIGFLSVATLGIGGYFIYDLVRGNPDIYGDLVAEDYMDDNTQLFADYETLRASSATLDTYQETYAPHQLFNIALHESQKSEFMKLETRGNVNAAGLKQTVLAYQLRNGDEYFYESISKGLFSVGKRFYQGEDVTWYSGKFSLFNSNYYWKADSEQIISIEEFKEVWGFDCSIISPYIVSSHTSLEASDTSISDGKLQLSLHLDPLYSVIEYSKQMLHMGDLETWPVFESVKLDVSINSDFLIESMNITEYYEVKKIGWHNAKGTLDISCVYGEPGSIPDVDTLITYN